MRGGAEYTPICGSRSLVSVSFLLLVPSVVLLGDPVVGKVSQLERQPQLGFQDIVRVEDEIVVVIAEIIATRRCSGCRGCGRGGLDWGQSGPAAIFPAPAALATLSVPALRSTNHIRSAINIGIGFHCVHGVSGWCRDNWCCC